MVPNRRSDLIRGVSALGLLSLILLGPPIVLGLAGWPLPASVPSASQMWAWFTGPSLDAGLVVKTFAVAGWIAWSCIVVMLGRELLTRVGLARYPYQSSNIVQRSIVELVAAVLLLLPSHATTTSSAPLTSAPETELVVATSPASQFSLELASADSPVSLAVGATSPDIASTTAKSYVVKRYDCLSTIARDELGDERRAREIWDLNKDRRFGAKRFTNPNLIYAGWDLLMPGDWVQSESSVGTHSSDVSSDRPGNAVLTPGQQSPPSAASATATQQETRQAPATQNAPRESGTDDESATPPLVPRPGSNTAILPPDPVSPETPSTTITDHAFDTPASQTPGHHNNKHGDRDVEVVTVVGSGLLAAGILELYRRRRDNQRRNRRFGRRIRPIAQEVAPLVVGLQEEEADHDADFLDRALRVLCQELRGWEHGIPLVSGAELTPKALTIVLGTPVENAPEPFALDEFGHWRLDRDVVIADPDVPVLLPTLVEIANSDDCYSLANLEDLGLVSVVGDQEQCLALLRSVALDLGTHGWADDLELIAVGLESELSALGRVTRTNSVSEAVEMFEAYIADAVEELRKLTVSSTIEARVRCEGDAIAPLVMLCAAPIDDASAARLSAAVAQVRGAAVVVSCDLAQADHHWTFDDKGLSNIDGKPRSVPADLLASTEALLADGLDVSDVAVEPQGVLTLVQPSFVIDVRDEPTPWQQLAIQVNVLGPLQFVGLCQSWDIDHVKVDRQLLTCLALHPSGLTDTALKRYVWDEREDRRIKPQTVMSAISRVRRVLGNDRVVQTRRLPRKVGDRYRLGDEVGTDWMQFQHLVGSVRPDSRGLNGLIEALGLVRGVPFVDVQTQYGWLDSADDWIFPVGHEPRVESFPDEMTRSIQDAAKLASDMCVDQGRFDDALFAITKGLLVDPVYERLSAERMRVFAAAGEPKGVESVFEELVAERHRLGDSRADLLESTFVLYEQCRSRTRLAATSP